MASIFDGVDSVFSEALGFKVGQFPHFQTRTAWLDFARGKHVVESFDENTLTRALAKISENRILVTRTPSRENWRLQRDTEYSTTSPEVSLERTIVNVCGENWFNQVPVASGLVDSNEDRHAKIDLANVNKKHAKFIELKWASNTPLFATIEILRYALVYIFSVSKRESLGYREKRLLDLESIELQVLAPHSYYQVDGGIPVDLLKNFQTSVQSSISEVARHTCDIEVTFGYYQFDQSFNWPELQNNDTSQMDAVRTAISKVSRVCSN